MTQRAKRLLDALITAALGGGAAFAAGQQPRSDQRLAISVLSSPADMITGNDALVRISGASAVTDATLTANGRDVTLRNVKRVGNALEGLVTGLPAGRSSLIVRATGGVASLDLTTYPITGPIFSGPHQKPFVCQTEEWKLGPPVDNNCSAATRIEWWYRSTAPTEGRGASPFKPLADPSQRPPDLAEATVSGRRTPFIVRLETGTINRAVYQIARLQADWNGRLIYTFGGSCMAGYVQGKSSGGVLNDLHLSRGYAVASSSLNVFGNNCNGVVSAETLMMVKERFIETIGLPRHTIGWGGSGGAMAQYEIAQNYPGLLDGIIPTMTFPDAVTYFIESEDCRLLLRPYLNKTNLTDEQKAAIGGFATWSTCDSSFANRPSRLDPADCDKDIPLALRYDPATNRAGARCSIYDGMINIFGRAPKTGFARRPHDNVGVQYGLAALNAGVISKEVFLDLNEKIGGYDIDGKWQPERTVADLEAIHTAYESGQTVTGGAGLASVPIIDARPYLDLEGNFHESYHSFRARARLVRANGHADNQVILRAPSAVYSRIQGEFLDQMERWLDAIERDVSNSLLPAKVVHAKPGDLVDACWTADGKKIADPAVYGKDTPCNRLLPPHASPRLVAGAPLTDDVWKCALKPIDWSDYKATLTAAEKARLQRIFPAGVCDWSKPGVGIRPVRGTWQRY